VYIMTDDVFTFKNAVVENNVASSFGGGVYATGGVRIQVFNSTFAHNQAIDGAGMYVAGGCDQTTSLLIHVSCRYAENARVEFYETRSVFSRNNASRIGGGMYIAKGYIKSIFITLLFFDGNVAMDAGGSIAMIGEGLALTLALIESSVAARGAGVFVSGSATVDYVTLSRNAAILGEGHGGAMYLNSSSSVTVSNVPIVNVSTGGSYANLAVVSRLRHVCETEPRKSRRGSFCA